MSELPISISNLNDFIFCPASIYFHLIDSEASELLIKDSPQINGSAAHAKSDNAAYSSKASMLQGIPVYSEEYNLCGKIDTFDVQSGILTERKKKIKTVYDGYVFQLYAQCLSLREMGYAVNEIRLYSMDDNKVYKIPLPETDSVMFAKFLALLEDIESFCLDVFRQDNQLKCCRCIYEPLCAYCAQKED